MLINAYPIYARKKLSPLARYSMFHFLMKNKAFDESLAIVLSQLITVLIFYLDLYEFLFYPFVD